MKEYIYFVSDIEVGAGDIYDDFSDDAIFADFLNSISMEGNGNIVKLVLNGDVFDFLKMQYKGHYPRYVTAEVSLWKLDRAIASHPIFFRALRGFLNNPAHFLYFNIGNHDADLVWSALQERLRLELGSGERISFSYFFDEGDLHAQHGHLSDTFYTIDHKKPIVSYRGTEILDLPWGAYACMTHLHKVKTLFPKEEQLYPKPELLKTHPQFDKAVKKAIHGIVRDMLVINPLFKFYDPTARIPYWKLVKHTWRYGFEFADDAKFLKFMVQSAVKSNPTKKVLVLGHSHIPAQHTIGDKKIFVTDTWRDEFDMIKNYKKKDKTYVKAEVFGGELGDVEYRVF